MKKIAKKLIKYSLVFIIFSFLGSLLEFISSLIFKKGVAYDKTIFLITGLKLFFIPFYGLVGMILLSTENLMSKYKVKICIRGFVHGLTITILELIFGYLGFLLFNVKLWDYSSHLINFQGYISLEMFLFWSIMGFVFSFSECLIKKLIKFLR